MSDLGGKLVFKVVRLAVGIPVGIAVRQGIERSWRATHAGNPARRPNDPQVLWTTAITYAGFSAAALAVGQLARNQGARRIYRRMLGSEPPV